jgi:two-component system copper resistance phosphate regulon response regulator CusR
MRLLLVEDDERLADLVARSLRERGYALDVVGDGEAATYQAAINEYDLIVLDVALPKKSGFEVSRELRKRGLRVPILMLTARDAVSDRVAGLDSGADDYLTKPFDFDELHARIRTLLRRMPELLPLELRVGDLVIDTRTQEVSRSGERIPLTTKEYTMLEDLARHAGRIIGRAELCEHVWDENHDPFSNAIEVYINRLRKKVDRDGAESLIHTHRGSGYRLGTGTVVARESSRSTR